MTYIYDPQLDHLDEYLRDDSAKTSILGGPALPALGHAVSGALGSATSNVITYPLSLAITRLQVQKRSKSNDGGAKDGVEYKSIPDALQRIYAEEGGISALYGGCVQDTAKTMMDSFLFFLAYNFARKGRLNAHQGKKRLPIHEELLVGMAAGAFSKFFTTPVSQIVTRKQIGAAKGSSVEIAQQIIRQKGVAGLWSGYSATLVLTLNPSLTFLFQETLLRLLVRRDKRADPGGRITFLIAAVSKAMASTITYPFSLAKSRAQVSAKAPTADDNESISDKDSPREIERKAINKVRRDTIFDMVVQIAREEGLEGLYRGVSGEVVKGFFSHGLTMLMKGAIHKFVIQFYYAILKLLRRYPSPEELAKMAGDTVSNVKDAVVEKVSDTKDAVVEKGREVLEGTPDVLGSPMDVVSDLYRKGREETADFVDEYVRTDDDDDNGWGW